MDVTVLFSNHGNILPDLVVSVIIYHTIYRVVGVCVMAVLRARFFCFLHTVS